MPCPKVGGTRRNVVPTSYGHFRGDKIVAGPRAARFGSVFDVAKNRPKKSFPNTFASAAAAPGRPILALMGAPLLAPGCGKRSALKRSAQRQIPASIAGQKPTVLYGA